MKKRIIKKKQQRNQELTATKEVIWLDPNAKYPQLGILNGELVMYDTDKNEIIKLSGGEKIAEYNKSIPTSTSTYEIANTKFVQETIINNSIPVDKNGIPTDADLNSYTKTGVYFQNVNTSAASGKNYPAPLAGMLEVFNANNMLYQKYTTYAASNLTKNDYGVTYTRGFYSPDWSPWKKQANLSDDQIFTGTNIFSGSVSIKKDNGQNNLQLLNSENNGFQFYSTTASASNMGTLRYISGSDTIDFRFEGTTKSITYKNSEIANIEYVSSEIAKIPTPDLSIYLKKSEISDKSLSGNFKSLQVMDSNVVLYNDLTKYAMLSGATFTGKVDGVSFNSITGLSDKKPIMDGIASEGTSTLVARQDHIHPIDTSRAPIDSPKFKGTPTTPTPTIGTDTTQVANIEFVQEYIDDYSIPIDTKTSISAKDLNDFITTGIFFSNTTTTGSKNFPITLPGMLEVHKLDNMVFQRYTIYSASSIIKNESNDVYIRGYYEPTKTWSAWKKQANLTDDQNFTGYNTVPTPSISTINNQIANMAAINQAVSGFNTVVVGNAKDGVLTITQEQFRMQWLQISGNLSQNLIIDFPTGIAKSMMLQNSVNQNGFEILLRRVGHTNTVQLLTNESIYLFDNNAGVYKLSSLNGISMYNNCYYRNDIQTNDNSYRIANTAFVQNVTSLMGKLGGNNVWTGSNTFNQISISEFTSILNNEKKGWQFFASSSGNRNISTFRYLGKDNFNIDLTFDSDAKMFNLYGTNIRLTGVTSVSETLTVENVLKSKFKCGPSDALILSNENNIGFYFAPTRAEGSYTESINGGTLSHYNPNTGKGTSLYFDGLNGKVKYNGYELATIRKSAGEYWFQSNITTTAFITVYYGNGVWVAGSNKNKGLYFSLDGKNWNQSNIDASFFYTVYYGNGIWVAGSDDNKGLYYSLDGKTWIQSNITTTNFYKLYYGNGVWVAGSSSNTGLYYSLDGKTWNQSNITTTNFYIVYYENGIWVAGSNSNTGLYYSLDGKTWNQSNMTSTNFLTVYYGNGVWVAGNFSSKGLYYSLDGKTWIQSNITTTSFYKLYYGNGVWVAGSSSNTGLYYSLDGKTWIQSNITTTNFFTVYYGNGIWVAGSYNNKGLYFSLDGKNWNQSNIDAFYFYTVYYENGIWVAGSYDDKGLYYSENIIGMFFIGIFDEILANKKFMTLLSDEDILTINMLNSKFKLMIDNDEQVSLDDIPDNIYHIINEFLLFDDIEFSMSQLVKYTIPFYSSEFSDVENEQLIAYLNECRFKLRMFETHELGSGINLQVPEKTNFINMLLTEGFI